MRGSPRLARAAAGSARRHRGARQFRRRASRPRARLLRAAHARAAGRPAGRADLRAASARAVPPRRPAVPPDPFRRARRGAGRARCCDPLRAAVRLAVQRSIPAETFVDRGAARRAWCAAPRLRRRISPSATAAAATSRSWPARAEALGMGLTVVPLLADAEGPISSTRIRRAAAGWLSRARRGRARPALGDPRPRVARRPARPDASASPPPTCRSAAIWSRPAASMRSRRACPTAKSARGVANLGRRPTVERRRRAGWKCICSTSPAISTAHEISVALHALPPRRAEIPRPRRAAGPDRRGRGRGPPHS